MNLKFGQCQLHRVVTTVVTTTVYKCDTEANVFTLSPLSPPRTYFLINPPLAAQVCKLL